MKKSQVLRAAVRDCLRVKFKVFKDRLVADKFLCVALSIYADLNPDARPTVKDIKLDISRLLHPYSSVEAWLRQELNLAIGYPFSRADLYAYRKRWSEHMAEQYEAQGD